MTDHEAAPPRAEHGGLRRAAVLGVALIPIGLFVGAMGWATFHELRDEWRWRQVRPAAVAEYEQTTLAQVRAASGTWALTYGTWPLALPEGMSVMGTEAVGDEGEVVFVSTQLSSERCLRLTFDADGLTGDEEISCRTYRMTGGQEG